MTTLIPDDELFEQLAALPGPKEAGGRGKRSPLSLWLIANKDRFAALLAEKRLSMDDIAAKLAEAGLLDGAKKPPTGRRLRKAWYEINRPPTTRTRRTARRAEDQAQRPLPVVPERAVEAPDPTNPYGFRPGKPRTRS